jgi:hypothetical protein
MALRTWGRPMNRDGSRGPWTIVTTAADGTNDLVFFTTLCQTLLLNLNESPFYADRGIPAHPTVVSQVFPDYYVIYTQRLFAPYFGNVLVSRRDDPSPVYDVNVTTHAGVKLNASIPIPY